jgi:hypothetical protein
LILYFKHNDWETIVLINTRNIDHPLNSIYRADGLSIKSDQKGGVYVRIINEFYLLASYILTQCG